MSVKFFKIQILSKKFQIRNWAFLFSLLPVLDLDIHCQFVTICEHSTLNNA